MRGAMAAALVALAIHGCVEEPRAIPTQAMIGGTRSLFLGERGSGMFNRDVESTTGERIREALRTGSALGVDILNRMATELTMLESAEPPIDLANAVARVPGAAGRFLYAGARRYAYVLRQAQDHPEPDPCGYAGPLHRSGSGLYDPRELCWWEETFRIAGLEPS